ncbi:MAG: LuxR C-terminal-related transcriptional regulator [Hyphomicrobiales bacterium]
MQKNLLETIGVFYECVGEEFDYQTAAAAYSAQADDTGISLSEIQPLTGRFRIRGYKNLSIDALNGWAPSKVKCPQLAKLKRALIAIPALTPVMRRAFVSDADWRSSETFARVAGPWGYHADGSSIISKGVLNVLTCGFARNPDQTEISAETLADMAVMNKHLKKALSMQQRISRVEQTLIETRNVLDIIDFGVVLYGDNGRILYANASATRIFADDDGLSATSSDIYAESGKANLAVSKLLNNVCRSELAMGMRSGGMTHVPRKSGRRPYILTAAPMVANAMDNSQASAVIFIFDPDKRPTTAAKILKKSYQLTQVEAELAVALMNGQKLDEIASERDVSYNTMKSHLHAVFSKTNTNRQVDLVSLLLRSATGFDLRG